MKQLLMSLLLTASLTGTAQALEVTNLDKIPHTVQLDVAGSQDTRTIAPGRTEYFIGQPNGLLSLLTAAAPSAGKQPVQSDGILKGLFGNGRTARIPAEDRDAFTIWEGGEIALQQRRRGGKYGR